MELSKTLTPRPFLRNTKLGLTPVNIELFAQQVQHFLSDTQRYEVLTRLRQDNLQLDVFFASLSGEETTRFDWHIMKCVLDFLRDNPTLDIQLHINISPGTLASKDFFDSIVRLSKEFGFDDF